MASVSRPQTVADVLVRRLGEHGVQHVFGYPGGQTTPIYDALARTPGIRHVLARDEQAAAFMADGYARATGKPGVCLAVCGPGVLNAATPLATAFTDSIPILLLSGQVPSKGLGLCSGYYHENDQLSLCATITKWRTRIASAPNLIPELDRAFTTMREGRPGPVFVETPLDVLRADFKGNPTAAVPPTPTPRTPSTKEVAALVKLVGGWRQPLLIVGGGAIIADAAPLVVQLAERLGAPVFHSLSGKSAVPTDHPLNAGLPWSRATSDLTNMEQFMSPLFAQADGLLAIGCRFSQATTGSWCMPLPAALAQIDVDGEEIGRHYPVTLGIQADAKAAVQLLLSALPGASRLPWTAPCRPSISARLLGLDLIEGLRRGLPRDAIIAGDITRLTYQMLAEFPIYSPRTFLHPAGYVSMGYGLPAALGAKAAFPERVVATVVGDGCFMMSGLELATAVQEKLPVIVILINDGSLTLIKAIQQRRYESRFIGVDLRNPDFETYARAFGVRHWKIDSDSSLEIALREAVASSAPALIEVQGQDEAG